MMQQWKFWRRVQKSPIVLLVFRALKMIQCAWHLRGIVQYMLDLRSQDLKENSSTSFWIKASVTRTLLLCVKWAYFRHYFWLHHLKSGEANRIKRSGKVAVWGKHCFSLSGQRWHRWNNRKQRKSGEKFNATLFRKRSRRTPSNSAAPKIRSQTTRDNKSLQKSLQNDPLSPTVQVQIPKTAKPEKTPRERPRKKSRWSFFQ